MSHEAIQSLLKETRRFEPPAEFARRARISSREAYDALYQESLEQPDAFWRRETKDLVFRTPWTKTFDLGVSYTPNWLEGLTLQMKVFNVLNAQSVTEYNEASQVNAGALVRDPDFLNDLNYQAPRYVRFTARYEF